MLTSDHQTCKSNTLPALSILALVSQFLYGCTTVETQSFNVVKSGNVESAFIATDADFSKYTQLLAEDMGIFFPKGSYTPPQDIQRLRQIFRSAFLNELQDYSIVSTAGPSTMKVQATLIDLRNATPATMMSLNSKIRDIASPGKLLFLMEMRDSETDAILARAADSAQTPSFTTAKGNTTDWTSVEDAAQHWAALFRQFLDQNLSR